MGVNSFGEILVLSCCYKWPFYNKGVNHYNKFDFIRSVEAFFQFKISIKKYGGGTKIFTTLKVDILKKNMLL